MYYVSGDRWGGTHQYDDRVPYYSGQERQQAHFRQQPKRAVVHHHELCLDCWDCSGHNLSNGRRFNISRCVLDLGFLKKGHKITTHFGFYQIAHRPFTIINCASTVCTVLDTISATDDSKKIEKKTHSFTITNCASTVGTVLGTISATDDDSTYLIFM